MRKEIVDFHNNLNRFFISLDITQIIHKKVFFTYDSD